MAGPDIILDINRRYLSIDPNKYIEEIQGPISAKYVQEGNLSFIRNRPSIDMRTKLSMCCLECGFTSKSCTNIKLKSQLSVERFIKNFRNKKRF